MHNLLFIVPLVILLAYCACILIYLEVFYGLLYTHIYKHHFRYYQSIGSPTRTWLLIPLNNFPLSLFRGSLYMFRWTVYGFPKNFPVDKRCHKFKADNSKQRKYLPRLILVWGLCVFLYALGCAVYLSTHPILSNAISH